MAFRFEHLDIYQKALDFTDEIYKQTKKFPPEEMWSLTQQLRRAAISITL